MCLFFSFLADNSGELYYFNEKQRKTLVPYNSYKMDSHTSIAHYYALDEDNFYKFEYNPFDRVLELDNRPVYEEHRIKTTIPSFLKLIEKRLVEEILSFDNYCPYIKLIPKTFEVKEDVPKNKRIIDLAKECRKVDNMFRKLHYTETEIKRKIGKALYNDLKIFTTHFSGIRRFIEEDITSNVFYDDVHPAFAYMQTYDVPDFNAINLIIYGSFKKKNIFTPFYKLYKNGYLYSSYDDSHLKKI